MILDSTLSLQMVLDSTGADVDATVDYQDWNQQGVPTPPATQRTASNGTTDVTILGASVENTKREPLRIHIYNGNASTRVVTLKTDNGATEKIIGKFSLATTKALLWEKGTQFQIGV